MVGVEFVPCARLFRVLQSDQLHCNIGKIRALLDKIYFLYFSGQNFRPTKLRRKNFLAPTGNFGSFVRRKEFIFYISADKISADKNFSTNWKFRKFCTPKRISFLYFIGQYFRGTKSFLKIREHLKNIRCSFLKGFLKFLEYRAAKENQIS